MSQNKKNQNKSPQGVKYPQDNTSPNQQIQKKSSGLKEWLISLLITLIVLGIVVALQYWFAKTSGLGMNMTITWIGNAVGGIIMLFIVHHFVKKPKDDGFRP